MKKSKIPKKEMAKAKPKSKPLLAKKTQCTEVCQTKEECSCQVQIKTE